MAAAQRSTHSASATSFLVFMIITAKIITFFPRPVKASLSHGRESAILLAENALEVQL